MKISRRKFLKLCGASGMAFGFSSMFTEKIVQALEEAVARGTHVLWLQAASDSGCSVSLLNTVHPSIAEVLLELISCDFHQSIMAASGDLASSVIEDVSNKYQGEFILVLEGAIPTADNGIYCTVGEVGNTPITVLDWIKELGPKAQAALAMGTCAAYGGIPAADPNPTGCKSVGNIFKASGINTPFINLPGCPPHPDWMVGTIYHYLKYGLPELDGSARPKLFYGKTIHDECSNRSYFNNGEFAEKLSDDGGLFMLGCQGPETYSDCPIRLWNSGVNWCIGSGSPCIGCVHPEFPDETSPFFAMLPDADFYLAGVQEEKTEEVLTSG